MDFTVEFYVTRQGSCPVQKFLDDLKLSAPNDFAIMLSGLDKLRNSGYHQMPLSEAIGEGLFEIRHVGQLNTRVLYFFMSGRRIVAVHGIRNKGQTIAARDRRVAVERMNDWRNRTK